MNKKPHYVYVANSTGITPNYRDSNLAFGNAIKSGIFNETETLAKNPNFVGNWMYMKSDIFTRPYKNGIIDHFKSILTREYIAVKVK